MYYKESHNYGLKLRNEIDLEAWLGCPLVLSCAIQAGDHGHAGPCPSSLALFKTLIEEEKGVIAWTSFVICHPVSKSRMARFKMWPLQPLD